MPVIDVNGVALNYRELGSRGGREILENSAAYAS